MSQTDSVGEHRQQKPRDNWRTPPAMHEPCSECETLRMHLRGVIGRYQELQRLAAKAHDVLRGMQGAAESEGKYEVVRAFLVLDEALRAARNAALDELAAQAQDLNMGY